tara:strand:+ start:43 stop:402 length:360 start_codon:yes stop_codon:yes gene_type:complete
MATNQLNEKLINSSRDGLTLGVSVEDIKREDEQGIHKVDINTGERTFIPKGVEEPNISIYTEGYYRTEEGEPYYTLIARCAANIKLTPRGKVKKVIINIPLSNTIKLRKMLDEIDGEGK